VTARGCAARLSRRGARRRRRCKAPETLIGDKCRLPCPTGQSWEQTGDGAWVCRAPLASRCKAPETLIGDKCRLPCPTGQKWEQTPDGRWQCSAPPTVCGPNQEAVLGKCFPKCPAGQVMRSDGKCAAAQ